MQTTGPGVIPALLCRSSKAKDTLLICNLLLSLKGFNLDGAYVGQI